MKKGAIARMALLPSMVQRQMFLHSLTAAEAQLARQSASMFSCATRMVVPDELDPPPEGVDFRHLRGSVMRRGCF